MKSALNPYHRLAVFFGDTIWKEPPDGPVRTLFYQILRVVLLTLYGLKDHFILLRASALAYSTILSIVPILAIAFSVMKGLGIQTRLERIVVNYLTAEQEELTTRIFDYIANTDFKVLGVMGSLMLIYAVLVMLGNVEQTFNHFWGVTHSRRLVRRISNYTSLLILGPLVMMMATAMIASFPSSIAAQPLSRYEFFQWILRFFDSMLPTLLLWAAFTAVYILVPNTKVHFIPALIAGIVCGTIWESAFKAFTGFNVGVANYNKIYGTFAALPVFIIWLYISWIIVLIGAQLSYAIQNMHSLKHHSGNGEFSFDQREKMAFMIMMAASESFHYGIPLPDTESLARSLAIPLPVVEEIIQILCDHHLLNAVQGDTPRFQPARNPGLITLYDISQAMRHKGNQEWRIPDGIQHEWVSQVALEKTRQEKNVLGTISLLDVMARSKPIVAG